MNLYIINSTIKGYHIFQQIPHEKIEMLVKEENDNKRDPHAMIIVMPSLMEIPEKYHEDVTRTAKQRGREKETVADITGEIIGRITGKIIGRVPANIGKLFRTLLSSKDIDHITCQSTQSPTNSKIPSSQQSYQRNHYHHYRYYQRFYRRLS